ncbi:hypothetical protein MPPM_4725 [Methylorubrum populi]|uniref:DUF551 domain-containing protein n=1 Tax=Methylorubrum populi TaxID=223967 RepID=A0A160PMS3_9HYPH|nr:DUF551 domain-containing protein [Methylorubrum populi]BAU93330.1 hypothetical protein MPPM_4725 [Methylorubrum populi]
MSDDLGRVPSGPDHSGSAPSPSVSASGECSSRDGWRPIATLPKDGEAFLAADARIAGGFQQVVFWDDDPPRVGWELSTADGPSYHRKAFTHWMPLPEPPAAEGIADGADPPCPRRDKWFRGCRFEPRYDVGAPDMTGMGRVRFADAEDAGPFYEALKPKTYLHDICVQCGKVVDRGGAR